MAVELFVLGIVSFIVGFLVKFVDFIEDDIKSKKNPLRKFTPFFGIIYGLLIGVVLFFWQGLVPLAVGVVLGELAARKIDAPGHLIAIFAFLILLVLLIAFGFFSGIFVYYFAALVVIFFLASLADEFADKYAQTLKNKFVKLFFSFRPVLEIAAFVVSLITNQWFIWITIFAFDLAYVIAAKNLPRIFAEK